MSQPKSPPEGHTAPAPAGTPSGSRAGNGATRRGRGGRNAKRNSTPRLRRGVGLVVINGRGQVLAGLRQHSKAEAGAHAAWQLPQGGIEGREKPLEAAYRELHEETGLTQADVELIHEFPHWTRYYLPKDWQPGKRFIGQTQRWFLLRYTGTEAIPPISRALHKEFSELDWVDVNWLISHVISFRQSVYRQVFRDFAPYLGTPPQTTQETAEKPE